MPNRRTLIALLAALPLAALPLDAAATSGGRRRTRVKAAPLRDSGETNAERNQRLARECRFLPNAGACKGFGYGS